MNCRNWEERLALYAGGDLLPDEAAEAARHVADCPGCQMFVSGLQESLGALREMHDDSIATADLAVVRARVMGELRQDRRVWWRPLWVFGLAAAAAVIGVAIALRPLPPVAPMPTVAIAPPAAPVWQPPAIRTVRHRRRPAAVARPVVAHAQPSGPPIVVKMVTDDPDVVIYWITDNSGEPR